MSDDEAFIREIVASPGDDAPRLVYADWLDERGDARGAFLRAEAEWARPWQDGRRPRSSGRVGRLAEPFDQLWVARLSRPPLGVCCAHLRFAECGPPLTAGELDAAAEVLGRPFPSALRAFLLNYNAGRVDPRQPGPPGATARCEAAERFYNFGSPLPETGEVSDLVADARYLQELAADDPFGSAFRFERFVPLATPEWDFDLVLLGVGADEIGKVYRLDNLQDYGFDPDNLSEVAPSLPTFLAKLKPRWTE